MSLHLRFFTAIDRMRSLDTPVLASGSLSLQPGTPGIISFSSAVPCGVLCDVSIPGGGTARAGAIFGAGDIQPLEPEPADFDAWWAAQKAELAAIPMDSVVTAHSTAIEHSGGMSLLQAVHAAFPLSQVDTYTDVLLRRGKSSKVRISRVFKLGDSAMRAHFRSAQFCRTNLFAAAPASPRACRWWNRE